MNREEVRALFDREMRVQSTDGVGYRVERVGTVVRLIGPYEQCIVYARPNPEEATRVVAEQLADLRPLGQAIEWKVYSHDQPPELPRALARAGFVAKPHETLMVFDLQENLPSTNLPDGLEFRRVLEETGFNDLEAVDTAAFGTVDPGLHHHIKSRLGDPRLGVFVAYVGGKPVSGGRVEVEIGKSFAGLFGGCTLPEFRGRGIYHHLVRVRADFARAHGVRYLTVEAIDTTSRPILERVGFAPLAGVDGWVLKPGPTEP